jgi:putative oxidoreductase
MKADIGLFLLRFTTGLMMVTMHGWSKLANFTNLKDSFPDPIGLGSAFSLSMTVFTEVFCAIALMLGLFTRWVSIPLAITMLVAAFVIHAPDPFAKKEFALLYAIPFITLFFTGGGSFSIDRFINKN